MMLGFIVSAALGASLAAPTTTAGTPSAEPGAVITDQTKLPLSILKANLPTPVDYDYDGDKKIDPLTIDLGAHGQLVLKIKSSRLHRELVLYQAHHSLTKLGATSFGMKLNGAPDRGVDMLLWGFAGKKHVASIKYAINPHSLVIYEDGRAHPVKWYRNHFLIK